MRETILLINYVRGKELVSFVVGNETILHFEVFQDSKKMPEDYSTSW